MSASLRAIQADITTLAVDAIVNAANSRLLGGSGVDGAIHRAAGPLLLEACRALNGCQVGEAKLTAGFRLPARYVIHAVGPIWQGGQQQEAALLAACYRNTLILAQTHALTRIAFPCISTGVYGYPQEAAARIALETVRTSLPVCPAVQEIIFCCFQATDLAIYECLL
jgi:O-acetyl-ADP-ribose deacetylase